MFVVIFRAKIHQLDATYSATAARLRELALGEFGCLRFQAVSEKDEEIALSYWPSEQHIAAWQDHPEHREAQRLGRERWYREYSVTVAQVTREYHA